MDIKLIALDMDGTLLDRDHSTVPARNVEALRAAAERGVEIVIASGRSWSLIRETVTPLGLVRYALTANGALTLDTAAGQVLDKVPMDRVQCAAIVEALRRHSLAYELYADGENYVQRNELEGMREFALSPAFEEMFLRNVTLVDDMMDVVKTRLAEKFDIFYVPDQVRAPLLAELSATGPFSGAGALGTNLELTAAGANKGAALARLCERLDITPEQVMAFGDGDNDLEMLSWAGCSFAMGNAPEAVKAAAKRVTGANYEGGVGMAIEKYLLSR